MRIRPATSIPSSNQPLNYDGVGMTMIGLIYLCLSMALSFWYLNLLAPAFSNDLWWAGYSAAKHQALLVDIINSMLTTHSDGEVDLLSPRATIDKTYGLPSPTTTVYSTYSRRLILSELTSIEYAITNLRSLTASWAVILGCQFCWVDFLKEFELAHTAERQIRCTERYKSNGAAYLEAVLRNIDWNEFISHYGGHGGIFTVSIQAWLDAVPAGQRFQVATALAKNSTSMYDEAAYWRSFQITRFQLQWTNYWQKGVAETMIVQNALGMDQEIVLKNIPYSFETWTTATMYWMFYNDMAILTSADRSLIRSANNSYLQDPPIEVEDFMGLRDSNGDYVDQIALFRDNVGPFISIDMFFVAPKASLRALDDAFQSTIRMELQHSVNHPIDNLAMKKWYPVPPSWNDAKFEHYGGSPLCMYGSPRKFVQESFQFYDVCESQHQLSVLTDRFSSVFAAINSELNRDRISTVCRSLALPDSDCSENFIAILNAANNLPNTMDAVTSLVKSAAMDVAMMKIEIVQFAFDISESTWMLLHQPILNDLEWNFFGWVYVLDWIQGKREVVSFEGDKSSLVLISALDKPQHFITSAESVTRASHMIYYLVYYISCVLLTVAIVCILALLHSHGHIRGAALLWYNHIAGAIWVGRPLLFLRGCTAILLLSTSNLGINERGGTMAPQASFVYLGRTPLESCIIAGEATWVVYVANDFFTVATSIYTTRGSLFNVLISWVAIVIIDRTWPIYPTVSLGRVCSATNVDQAVSCASAFVVLGDTQRVRVLFTVQGVALITSLTYIAFLRVSRWKKAQIQDTARHLLGVADVYLQDYRNKVDTENDSWSVDKVSCIMAGLVPLIWRTKTFTFDIKLWVLREDKASKGLDKKFSFHRRVSTSPTMKPLTSSPSLPHLTNNTRNLYGKLQTIFGILYAAGAIAGSVSYLQISRVNLANDLLWVDFNMTGVHGFLANWWNHQLILGVTSKTVDLNTATINQPRAYASATEIVKSPSNYGSLLQYTELNDVATAITGLRRSDACKMPWIFTSYCYVDFEMTWELATTSDRQNRCRHYKRNAAVYLASPMRNLDYSKFLTCWGEAFETAIATELRGDTRGRAWLATLSTPHISVDEEATLWHSYNLSSYTTQWQNFKHIGLVNTYAINNAFGVSYSFTLQRQTGGFRLDKQTSNKMYWGLANDFYAIVANRTSGSSLVRTSASYAFANRSIQEIFVENGTLQDPLPQSFLLFETILGPFGSIDMYIVQPPQEGLIMLDEVYKNLQELIALNLAARQGYFAIDVPTNSMNPVPQEWLDIAFYSLGGSPLCADIPLEMSGPVTQSISTMLSWDIQCPSVAFSATFVADRARVIAAVILANLTLHADTNDQVQRICNQESRFEELCVSYVNDTIRFAANYMLQPSSQLVEIHQTLYEMKIEIIQHGRLDATSPFTLYRLNLMRSDDFLFFGWLILIDWFHGLREVVRFDGDVSTMTLMTEYLGSLEQQVNPNEIPINVSVYLHGAVTYVTIAIIVVATLMLIYVVLARGYIEVLNLLELQRVGAIVWVGRPLLVARSLTAIGMLSTSSLQLQYTGSLSFFNVVNDPWYKTLLAANEVTWLVAIVNDIAMALTQEYTMYYATFNSILVWLTTAFLSIFAPSYHSLNLAKKCSIVEFDFQIECTSGSLHIGHLSRFILLISIVLACNCLCYLSTRVLVKRMSNPNTVNSIFVYAGARYLFFTSKWIYRETYYMDRMSAALNGILTVRWHDTMYGLDIKLWHTFRVDLVVQEIPLGHSVAQAAAYALPLSLDVDHHI